MKKYFTLFAVILFSSLAVVGVVSAATTISTDISTDGQLSVTGTSTLMGNVGIGTATPMSKLSVNGGITATAINNTSHYEVARTNTSGVGSYVEIGTINDPVTQPSGWNMDAGYARVTVSSDASGTGDSYNPILATYDLYWDDWDQNGIWVIVPPTTTVGLSSNSSSPGAVYLEAFNSNLGTTGTAYVKLRLVQISAHSNNFNVSVDIVRPQNAIFTPLFGTGVDATAYAVSSAASYSVYNANAAFKINQPSTYVNKLGLGYNIQQFGLTYALDALSSTTNQTVSNRVANFTNNGSTFNTTSGALSSYGVYTVSTSTRSSGSNALTNIGLYASALGAQSNYAAIFDQGSVGVGTTNPTSQFQVATSTANATTSIEIGKSGQNKGSCLVLYDAAGNAVYASVAPGATTFTLSTVSCK